jgi:hypothetical protein
LIKIFWNDLGCLDREMEPFLEAGWEKNIRRLIKIVTKKLLKKDN